MSEQIVEELQEPTQEQEAAQVTRPERQRWFSAFPTGTLAILSGTCSGIGLGSLGLERLAMFVTEQPSFGQMLDLPLPFISAPLGVGALALALLAAWSDLKVASGAIALALSYWALTWYLWPAGF